MTGEANDTRPVVPQAVLDRLLDRVDALEGEVAALRSQGRSTTEGSGTGPAVGGAIGRRAAIASLAGAAAVGTAALAPAAPAAADNGDALVLGSSSNHATAPTGLAVGGSSAAYGVAVTDNGVASVPFRAAVVGHARGTAFGTGVFGFAQETSDAGVRAYGQGAASGVVCTSDTGIAFSAYSGTSVGAQVQAASGSLPALNVIGGGVSVTVSTPRAGHLWLQPTSTSPSSEQVSRAPGTVLSTGYRGGSSGPAHATLWACVSDGRTAADFRVLAGPGSAGSLHVLPVPARVYDSRPGTFPSVGPKTTMAAGEIRTLDLKVNASNVPAGATAAILSVLLVNTASGAGNFTVWAAGRPRPQANTMVWGGTAGRHSTTALTSLDAAARVQVSPSIPTHLVIDVVAYYR